MSLVAYQPPDWLGQNRRRRSGLALEPSACVPQLSTRNYVSTLRNGLVVSLIACRCGRWWSRPQTTSPLDQSFILIMRTDPKPFCPATFHNGESAMVVADARRPEVSNLLEVQRGMTRVAQPQFEVLSGEPPDLWWQSEEPATKASRCRGNHRAARLADLCFRLRGADKPRGAFRFGRLPRSGDPIHGHGARANAARVRRTLCAAVSQSPARFPESASRIQFCFNGAALAIARKGSAGGRRLYANFRFNGAAVSGWDKESSNEA